MVYVAGAWSPSAPRRGETFAPPLTEFTRSPERNAQPMSLLSSRNSRDESTCRESQKPRVRPDGGRAVPSAGVLSCVQNQVFFGSGTGYPAGRSAVVANVRLTISERMHKF